MNIKRNINKKTNSDIKKIGEIKKLSSSESNLFNIDLLEKVYKTPTMQFKIDDIIFARFGIDIDSPLALTYHFNKTSCYSDFLNSINNFLASAGSKISSSDESKLKAEYEKYTRLVLKAPSNISQQLVDEIMK